MAAIADRGGVDFVSVGETVAFNVWAIPINSK
jgi:hypothetical protein